MKNKRTLLFWICLLIGFGALSFMVTYWMLQKQRGDIYEQMQKENESVSVTDTPTVTPQMKEEDQEEKIQVEIPIDFASLKEVNEEIYAWIRIPGTKVDYPILQRPSDDAYYLNHTVEGKEGLPGSIYTESLNTQDFTDRNTVIYGHNMRDGSMFGDLSLYRERSYMEEHEELIIYTPEHIYTYKIFAAVTYDNRHILLNYNFEKEVALEAFLESVYSVKNMYSYINKEIEVGGADRIITLSTCNNNDSQRFIVEAVLVDEQ